MDQTIYLKDKGYTRKSLKNKQWKYLNNKTGKEITSGTELQRISSLCIPPQWKDVWISSSSKSAIQVKGTDSQGRKQYLYSEEWKNTQKCQKYSRMKRFMKDLPVFTQHLNSCLKDRTLNKDKIISAMFKLMMKTNMRVGNERYAEENNTFGLTTLKKKHFSGTKVEFKGKSGIDHEISIKGLCPHTLDVITQLLQQCRSKNNEVFPYNHIDMNTFLKEWMGKDYTCKDFRTLLVIKSL